MLRQRRFLAAAAASLVAIWLVVWAGHWYLENLKVTADKVRAYIASVDFAHLTGAARAKALKDLEAELNAMSYEERQRFRADQSLRDWFAHMTEDEKEQFVDATLPTGVQQMINAFEQLPQDERQRAIDNAMRNLSAANNGPRGGDMNPGNTNGPTVISPELEAEIRNIGLKTFYSQSSAETKAEVAPLLEELQRQMESGRAFRRQQ
ncbi:MAG: hypothetical protein ABSE16_20580 [Verrucomicrobiota bacterium]|jgi:hypothetical protein